MSKKTSDKKVKKVLGKGEQQGEDTNVQEKPVKTPEAPKVEESDSVDVVNGNLYVRTYSRKVHGDDFMVLAKEFCQKKPQGKGAYSLVDSEAIKKVEVRYREKADAELPLDKQKSDAPMEDKVRVFDDKEKALSFKVSKFGSTVVISKRK